MTVQKLQGLVRSLVKEFSAGHLETAEEVLHRYGHDIPGIASGELEYAANPIAARNVRTALQQMAKDISCRVEERYKLALLTLLSENFGKLSRISFDIITNSKARPMAEKEGKEAVCALVLLLCELCSEMNWNLEEEVTRFLEQPIKDTDKK